MMKSWIGLLLPIHLAAAMVSSASAWGAEPTPVDQVCKAWMKFRATTAAMPALPKVVAFGVRDRYFRRSLVSVSRTSDTPRLSAVLNEPGLAFIHDVRELPASETATDFRKDYAAAVAENQRLRRDITALLHSAKSAEACATLLRDHRFDAAGYVRKMREFADLGKGPISALSTRDEADLAVAGLRQASQPWEIFRAPKVWEIHRTLRNLKSPRRVLLFLHAKENGVLVDADGVSLPATFFREVREQILELTLYACYPERVRKFYFENDPHPPQLRLPQLRPLARSFWAETTPVKYFPAFVRKAESHPSRITPLPLLPRDCQIEVSPAIADDHRAVFLNGEYIGSVGEGVLRTPCDRILAADNRIVIKSLALIGPEPPALMEVQLRLPHPMSSRSVVIETFRDTDGHFISAKAEFPSGAH